MIVEISLISLCLTCSVIMLGIAIKGLIDKEYEHLTPSIAIFLLLTICAVCIIAQWDNKVMLHATEFFATRDRAYKCDDVAPEVCKYKIIRWKSDSIQWQDRLIKTIPNQ